MTVLSIDQTGVKVKLIYLFFISTLLGCSHKHLTIEKEYVDRYSLASTFVKSPDLMQKNPPTGLRLWINWDLPVSAMNQPMILTLQLLYKNYTVEKRAYPISKRSGQLAFSLLGDKYESTGGLLSYRVDIETQEGDLVSSWVQQMWFNLINDAKSISLVSSKPKQGSVTETSDFISVEESDCLPCLR